jgi:cell wall-associated NlpC family hydrolase
MSMALISTRRRKFGVFAASMAVVGSSLTGLVVLSGGAQAGAPSAIAAAAKDASETLTGLRFLEKTNVAAPQSDVVSAEGVVETTPTTEVAQAPQVGWFKATYAEQIDTLSELVAHELKIPASEFVASWSKADDVRMHAVFAALGELGKPYVWNSEGPEGYDCSGLIKFAWGAAGIELPHFSMAQANSGDAVDAKAIEPGDLVHAPGHIQMSLGVRDAVVQSTAGGVQVSHWKSKSDGFTDPLKPRTVKWTTALPPSAPPLVTVAPPTSDGAVPTLPTNSVEAPTPTAG